GDTEDIPEMSALKDIDIAFLPVNQPYTMTVEQAVRAAKLFSPDLLYPYHFGETDVKPIKEQLRDSGIEVRIRKME
ncbi:MAG: MBL fold metallo-hydrolase, partial [Proteiniphilum sp.]